jgi:hypothetical protein
MTRALTPDPNRRSAPRRRAPKHATERRRTGTTEQRVTALKQRTCNRRVVDGLPTPPFLTAASSITVTAAPPTPPSLSPSASPNSNSTSPSARPATATTTPPSKPLGHPQTRARLDPQHDNLAEPTFAARSSTTSKASTTRIASNAGLVIKAPPTTNTQPLEKSCPPKRVNSTLRSRRSVRAFCARRRGAERRIWT